MMKSPHFLNVELHKALYPVSFSDVLTPPAVGVVISTRMEV